MYLHVAPRSPRLAPFVSALGWHESALPPGRAADWAQLAADHGYCDQAHLIDDFRDIAGITPGTYRPRSAAERNHLPVA
jgi:AraC-like DNA-binding protein